MNLQTEYEFTLPGGYVDPEGNLHRRGVMRLATAMDEIAPLRDARVRDNQAYLAIVLLSRVIVQLGSLPEVTTAVVENLFAADLAYLQALYQQINEGFSSVVEVSCPQCQARIEVDLAHLGGES